MAVHQEPVHTMALFLDSSTEGRRMTGAAEARQLTLMLAARGLANGPFGHHSTCKHHVRRGGRVKAFNDEAGSVFIC